MKTVIFDNDGVISDANDCWYEAYRITVEEFGGTLTEREYFDRNTKQAKTIFEEIIKLKGLDATADEMVKRKEEHVLEIIPKKARIKEGALKALQMLKDNNVRYCMATAAGSRNAELILDAMGVRDEFPNLFTSNLVGGPITKPPLYEVAMEKMGEKPENCVLVEDSIHGIKAGKKLGMKCIGVVGIYSRKDLEKVADRVVDNIGEITMEDLK